MDFNILSYIAIFILVVAIITISIKERKKSMNLEAALEEKLEKSRVSINPGNLETMRRERLARIEELAKAAEFGRISEGIVHDLLTPLTSIVLQSEKSQDPNSLSASRRISAYVKDIRSALSREEIDKVCTVGEELDTVLHLLAYKIRHENISVSTDKDDMRWHGNPLKLHQIFLNLISNSVDSFENHAGGNRTIKISVFSRDGDNIIEIRDNGCGIKTENMDRLFSAYFTTKKPGHGTGIGLSTVKGIVEKDLHGTIWAESQEGKGSVFTIKFPK